MQLQLSLIPTCWDAEYMGSGRFSARRAGVDGTEVRWRVRGPVPQEVFNSTDAAERDQNKSADFEVQKRQKCGEIVSALQNQPR